jgi:AmmeMemoRadiSam system protein B
VRAVRDLRRVVILGPAHFVPLRGIGTSSAARFETPLGPVALDREAIRAVERLSFVASRDEAHAPEHCLEVQLPLLLHVLGPVPIVPLLVGEASPGEVAAAIRAAGGAEPEAGVLTVVSTDLSHFLPDEAARNRDGATCEAILASDDASIDAERACGHRALAGLLRLAREEGLRAIRLDARTSADAGGSVHSVVGYAAFAFVRRSRTREGPG